MRLIAPTGCGSISIRGMEFKVSADGNVDVPGEVAAELISSFGFADPDSSPKIAAETAAQPTAEAAPSKPAVTRAELESALAEVAANPSEFKNADYVVNALRSHFGDLVTEKDETEVRSLFAKPAENVTLPAAGEAAAAQKITVEGNVEVAGHIEVPVGR